LESSKIRYNYIMAVSNPGWVNYLGQSGGSFTRQSKVFLDNLYSCNDYYKRLL